MRISDWSSDVCSSDLFSQTPQPVYPVMTNRHDAVMKSLIYNFEHPEAGLGILVDKMDVAESVYFLTRFVNAKGVPLNWRPLVFGQKAHVGTRLERETDKANTQPLEISRQIFTEPKEETFDDFEMVKSEEMQSEERR